MTPQNFFATYGPLAQAVCKGTGLCASINLAQGALESAYGASRLAREANNYFGIKAGKTWKGPVIWLPTKEQDKTGKETTIMAKFRKYETPQDCFADRVRLFRAWPRYLNLFERTTAYREAHQLKEDGYATDIHYPAKLVKIIEQYGLTKYDD